MSLTQIPAPYGFVPLSRKVVFPAWGDQASQDWPFPNAICGHLDLEIAAQSPIFVRGTAKEKDDQSFQTPDGTFAIPGSAVRGMLRNVLEIASFGKFTRVNDRRYGVRDLHNRDLYGQHMAGILTNARTQKREPMPLVNAGWMVRGGDGDVVAEIQPCDFAKIEYAEIQRMAVAYKVRSGFNPGRKQSAVAKYQAWTTADGARASRRVKVRVAELRKPDGKRLATSFGKVHGPGDLGGVLVFTGQPSEHDPARLSKRVGAGNPKHHDFVFLDTEGRTRIPVSEKAFKDFEFIHSDGGQQHRLTGRVTPNEEWGYWRDTYEREPLDKGANRVPVFFLLNADGTLRAFGLAMMFRLAYRQSVHEALQTFYGVRTLKDLHQQDATATRRLDLAEALFGRVREQEDGADAFSLRGRVGFGPFLAQGAPRPLPLVRAVLGAPKASYYPNYIEQSPSEHGGAPTGTYKTFMDTDAVPRGWKRYRPLAGHGVLRPPDPTRGDGSAMNLDRVESKFAPLPAGTKFTGRLHLHNLKAEELGALLWCLDFGGEPDTFHKLGLARALGYGTVLLKRTGLVDDGGKTVDAESAKAAFVRWISAEVPGWADSDVIRELVALARPQDPSQARHMQINHPVNRNEFQEAKKANLALRRAAERSAGGTLNLQASTALGSAMRGAIGAAQMSSGTSTGGVWRPMTRGAEIRVRLIGQNRKEKWRFEHMDSGGVGTLVQGTAPADAAIGQEVAALVIRGETRSNIEASWKS